MYTGHACVYALMTRPHTKHSTSAMMKSHILLFATAVLLAACHSDEIEPVVPADKSIPVSFAVSTIADQASEAGSRAAVSRAQSVGLETLDIDSMTVWGVKTTAGNGITTNPYSQQQNVMDAYQVLWTENTAGTSASNSHDWEYVGYTMQDPSGTPGVKQTVKYWDFGATSYRFYALASSRYAKKDFAKVVPTPPAISDRYEVKDAATLKTFAMRVDGSGKNDALAPFYYSDLWFSNNSSTVLGGGQALPTYGETVSLMFHSPFVRVRFMFTFPDDVDRNKLRIANIRFVDTDQAARVEAAGGDESAATTPLYADMTITYPLGGTTQDCTQTRVTSTEDASTAPATTFTYPAVGISPVGLFAIDIPYEETATDYAPVARKWYYALPLNRLPLALADDPDTPENETTLPFVQGDYTLTARINGKTRSAVVPAQYMQWREGYSYTYIFKVSDVGFIFENAIEVMTHWQAGTSQDTQW